MIRLGLLATVNCRARNLLIAISNSQITTIDAQRPSLAEPFNGSVNGPPGHHWVEVALSQFFAASSGPTDVFAIAADRRADRH